MENLEVKVRDVIKIFEGLEQALEYICDLIKEWYNSNDERLLEVSLSKKTGIDPPSLSVSVKDSTKLAEAVGKP